MSLEQSRHQLQPHYCRQDTAHYCRHEASCSADGCRRVLAAPCPGQIVTRRLEAARGRDTGPSAGIKGAGLAPSRGASDPRPLLCRGHRVAWCGVWVLDRGEMIACMVTCCFLKSLSLSLVLILVTIVLAMATGPRRHWSLTSSSSSIGDGHRHAAGPATGPSHGLHLISAQHSTASFRNTVAAVARTADKVQELGREQEGGAIRRKVESI